MNFSNSNFEILELNNFFSKAISPKVFSFKKKKILFFAGEKNNKFTKIYKVYLDAKNNKIPNLCFEPDNKFQRVLSPDVIKIKENYYMFFEGKVKNKTRIFYAVSSDLNFWQIEKKPLIFDKIDESDYGAPKCILHPNKKNYYLYYYKKIKLEKNIHLSILDHNLNILETYKKPVIRSDSTQEDQAVYSPDIYIEGSKWHMFYAAWGQKPLKGIIMKATSKNGITWSEKKKVLEPNIFEDIKHCSEPCFLKEKNKMNLYYEGCDIFNNWKIIKRTLKN